MVTQAALAAALLESDRLYFELGARLEPIDGAMLAWMPGMEWVPAACVVQRVDQECGSADAGRRWVGATVERLRAKGCSVARIYLDAPSPSLEAALAEAGFRRRVEIGYLSASDMDGGGGEVTLRPVQGDVDWATKHRLHAGTDGAADGRVLSGRSWVELERAKCDDGRMRAYLIEVDGAACGALAEIRVEGLLRAKNVFVHPDWRRRGIGAGAMRRMVELARAQGCAGAGIFGVEGRPGNALYRHLGMSPVVERFEWSRSLSPAPEEG
jgi:GNAT superfamily N-acetyltransferase